MMFNFFETIIFKKSFVGVMQAEHPVVGFELC